ncbi:DUF4184 family protein [Rugosimonospora africana]|uniref:DUF4184 family protein n=1 Tax=Rugosimonospora africana TaxID=556532 RepID=UPI0019420E0C|nr:DUF4184 family protein [Rugosimonospora africana]
MPLTFPSHAAAVLPIKLAAPSRWDGVALVIGSTSPDLPYLVYPYVWFNAHTWLALVWFCVPVTLIGTRIARWAAPATAAHLPNRGGFALRDYGVLGQVRHRWYVTVGSAFVGALTHVVWDSFTHARPGRLWSLHPLDRIAVDGQPWWAVLQLASTVVGALIAVGFAWYIGRRRLIVAWHGVSPPVPVRPGLFWAVVAVVVVAGIAPQPVLAGVHLANVLGVRLLVLGAVALLAATAVTRVTQRDRVSI